MFDKNKAFNTTGEFVLLDGTKLEREGLAWFDTEIKKAVDDLHSDLADLYDELKTTYNSTPFRRIKELIDKHFEVLKDVRNDGEMSQKKQAFGLKG